MKGLSNEDQDAGGSRADRVERERGSRMVAMRKDSMGCVTSQIQPADSSVCACRVYVDVLKLSFPTCQTDPAGILIAGAEVNIELSTIYLHGSISLCTLDPLS